MAHKQTYYEMKGADIGRVLVYTTKQQSALGKVLAEAVSEGRQIEVRQKSRQDPRSKPILVLLSAADDMGRVYEITSAGKVTEIGVTEKPLGDE